MKSLPGLLACTLLIVGCGHNTSPAKQPTAQEIIGKPAKAPLNDAHFSLHGAPANATSNTTVAGEGDIVFRPQVAFRLTATTITGATSATAEVLSIEGQTYQRAAGRKWSRGPASSPVPAFSAWSSAANPRLVGEEPVDGSRCWHVVATTNGSNLDLWVRKSDGFPIRSRVGQLIVDYENFNTGVSISKPPATDIVPS